MTQIANQNHQQSSTTSGPRFCWWSRTHSRFRSLKNIELVLSLLIIMQSP